MSQCPTCGSQVPAGAVLCPDCGMDLQTPVADQTNVPGSASPPATAARTPAAAPPIPVAPQALARLTLKRGGVPTSEIFQLGERVVVGRFDADSGPVDIDLGPLPEAAYISRHHAEISRNAAGGWVIRDLGSRNGTFIRGSGQSQFQRVEGEQNLNDGDEVALGNARFDFRIEQ